MTATPHYDPDDFTDFDNEFESELPAPEIDRDENAEHHLRCYKWWCDEYDKIENRFDTEVARLVGRADRTLGRMQMRKQWHLSALHAYYTRKGEKRIVLANATLSSIKGRERVEIHDVDALGLYANTNQLGLVRYEPHPEKKHILAHIKKTGELPPGVDLIRGEDSFRVKF